MSGVMFVIGLTGSVGMGKTTAARFFAEEGVPVHDADAVVHRLYAGEAAPAIEAAFPGATQGGKVDRNRLAALVLDDPVAMKKLESIFIRWCMPPKRRFSPRQKGAERRLPCSIFLSCSRPAPISGWMQWSWYRRLRSCKKLASLGVLG